MPFPSLQGLTRPDGGAGHLWPRWIVLRAVGFIYVLIFAGIIGTSQALVGPHGIYPVAVFFARMRAEYPGSVDPFFLAPSLFWASTGKGMIVALEWTGLAAAVAVTLNLWPRMALFACWIIFLSFFSAWGVFSPAQLDGLMIEAALLCIPFAPAGFRPGLGRDSPPRPIALFALRWLLFRVMFESGLVKLVGGDPHWRNFTALDVMYETAPFPTLLGYLDHQLPHAYHLFEYWFTFLAELVAPLLAAFGGRRARWFAFGIWVTFQAGIELTCNFGWLNLASAGLGFLLLDDRMIAALLRRPEPADEGRPPEVTGRRVWSLYGLRVALGAQFCLTLVYFGLHLAAARGVGPEEIPDAIAAPAALFANFYSANAYTLYSRFQPVRHGVEFAGSNDGGRTWRPYPYRYIAQQPDRICPFVAPWYPRFEAALEDTDPTEGASQFQGRTALYRAVAVRLLAGDRDVIGLFPRDPFSDRPPAMIRMRYYQLAFTNLEGRRKSGHYWRKEYKGEFAPMVYLDERGRIVSSDLSEGDAALRKADYAAALAIYRRQYEVGYPFAGFRLAYLIDHGLGVRRDPEKALAIYADLAARGEVEALNDIGLCHENGIGVPTDYPEAAASYRAAASRESLSGLYNLGALYAKERVVPRNDLEGLTLLLEAQRRAVGVDSVAVYVQRDRAGYVKLLEERMTPAEVAKAGAAAARRVGADDPLGTEP